MYNIQQRKKIKKDLKKLLKEIVEHCPKMSLTKKGFIRVNIKGHSHCPLTAACINKTGERILIREPLHAAVKLLGPKSITLGVIAEDIITDAADNYLEPKIPINFLSRMKKVTRKFLIKRLVDRK